MTVGRKIIGGYMLVLVIMLIAVGTGLYFLGTLNQSYREFVDFNVRLIDGANELQYEVNNQASSFRGFLLYPADEEMFVDELRDSRQRFEDTIVDMQSQLNQSGPAYQDIKGMLDLLESLSKLQLQYQESQEKAITLAVEEWNRTDALWADRNEVRPLTAVLIKEVKNFHDQQMKLAALKQDSIDMISKRISFMMVLVSMLALVSGLAIGIFTTRSITRQIQNREVERDQAEEQFRTASYYARSLIEANIDPLVTIGTQGKVMDTNKATELATGVSRDILIGSDFSNYFTDPEKAREVYQQAFSKGVVKDYPLTIHHSSDKLTEVVYNATLFKDMKGEVQGILAVARDITERKQMEENLRRQNQELIETREAIDAAGILASSVSVILKSTTQLAAVAQETASAVNEAATSIEEIKQTAQHSSEKAMNVSEGSQKVTLVAKQGKTAVDKTIAGINLIKEQTESVAETIITLSEQSQAIGEIIASVNDIAEQSNLLAVNAAIEASKAGEQGKGFAIVAQEVRSLAEQSKQATAQVRTILNDIQKATSTAVLATEQGSKAVEAGVHQSIESGEAIRKLDDSIVESSHAATQIAASSQQQLTGLDQIALAMANIKTTTSQHMEEIKQLEAAARDLDQLGQKLKTMVKVDKSQQSMPSA